MRISIVVKTNAKESRVEASAGKFKVLTKEPAKEGKANATIIKLLAKHFNVSKLRVSIVLGLKSKKKIIEIK